MVGYVSRLTRDLDRWIAEGLVPEASRAPILDSAREENSVDASTALAFVGVLLLGAAIVAFVAANWSEIPRIVRFGVLLAALAASTVGSAWAASTQRPLFRELGLLLSALIFAASVGLVGQIFDIAGEPKHALLGAGAGSLVLAAAGRSSGAAMVALVLIGLGDLVPEHSWWLLAAAPVGLVAAAAWRSAPLAHAAAIGVVVGLVSLTSDCTFDYKWFALAGVLAVFSLAARALAGRLGEIGSTAHGWLTWGALAVFAFAPFGHQPSVAELVVHRLLWLVLAGAVLVMGRNDRRPLVTAAGVVGLIAAAAALLSDLGLDLATASAVFAAGALLALVVGWILRRRNAR